MNKKILVGIGIFIGILILISLLTKKGPGPNNSSLKSTTDSLFGKKEIRVGEDICGEFPKEWVTEVTGKAIIKTERLDITGTHTCKYYVDENNFVTLRRNNLNVENQKKGQQILNRTISTNDKIKMEHFVVVQGDGLINDIVLVINPNLFIAVDRSSTKASSETEIIDFASMVADRIQKGENVAVATPTEKKEAIVPLPQETDIIRSFFNIIGEHRSSDAVMMMSPINTKDDSTKQAWGVQFNAFAKMEVKNIEPSMQSDWTENTHGYQVSLNVQMKPEAANAVPMPNYGWDNGENVRFIFLEKIDGKWMINGIATGP